MLNRYAAIQGMQIAQTAACNRLHDIVQRLARWLLMTQDRVDSGYGDVMEGRDDRFKRLNPRRSIDYPRQGLQHFWVGVGIVVICIELAVRISRLPV